MGGGSSTGYNFDQPGSASNKLASIVQRQYANYQAMFVPEENKLIRAATDPMAITNAGRSAIANSADAFRAQQQSLNKDFNTRGIALTPVQRNALERRSQVQGVLAGDDAANRAGIAAYDTTSSALSGAPSPAGILPQTVTPGTP